MSSIENEPRYMNSPFLSAIAWSAYVSATMFWFVGLKRLGLPLISAPRTSLPSFTCAERRARSSPSLRGRCTDDLTEMRSW